MPEKDHEGRPHEQKGELKPRQQPKESTIRGLGKTAIDKASKK